MQSGYRYNRDAQAKALKAAVKNSKRDKVLYGAIIKAESGFQSTPPTITVASDGTANSTTQKELQERRAMGSNDVDANLLKKLQERALILDNTVRPQDSYSNAGSPKSVASTQSKAFSEPMDFKPKVDIGGPKISMALVDELKAKLTKGNFGLRPRDSRQPNVVVGTSSDTTSSVGTPTSSVPSDAVSTIAPIDKKQPVAVNTRNRFESLMTTSSESDVSDSSDESNESNESNGLSQIKKIDLYTDDATQKMAYQLFNTVQAIRENDGHSVTKSIRLTPYSYNGDVENGRLRVLKTNNGIFHFDRILGRGRRVIYNTLRYHPNEFNIDIKTSLQKALNITDEDPDRLKFDPKTAATTGLGVAADNIGSSRVIYKSNKGGSGVSKGQLYLMQPQLIKGHIRLYNKSGRPVVSRSNVSPSFQRLAKDIVERNTFEADDYSGIDSKESADVNKFIEATKPIQPRNINRLSNADTIWQMKKRYEVLVGELSAGNHGKIVRDEMETILRNLIRLHALNQDKGRELIRSLRDF